MRVITTQEMISTMHKTKISFYPINTAMLAYIMIKVSLYLVIFSSILWYLNILMLTFLFLGINIFYWILTEFYLIGGKL